QGGEPVQVRVEQLEVPRAQDAALCGLMLAMTRSAVWRLCSYTASIRNTRPSYAASPTLRRKAVKLIDAPASCWRTGSSSAPTSPAPLASTPSTRPAESVAFLSMDSTDERKASAWLLSSSPLIGGAGPALRQNRIGLRSDKSAGDRWRDLARHAH